MHERGVVSGLSKFIDRDVLVILLPSNHPKDEGNREFQGGDLLCRVCADS